MNSRSSILLLALSTLIPQLSFAQGSLTPPAGPPVASMKTLDQVEARIPLVAGQPGVTVSAAGTITISQPGSYYLTKNVTITTNVNGIEINADATVDLNGFSIIGTAAAITTGDAIVVATTASASVRNGFIRGGTTVSGTTVTPSGFHRGVEGIAPAAGVRSTVNLSDLDLRGLRADGVYLRRASRVDRCTVQAVGGSGIDTYQFILNLGAGDQRLISTVTDCHASDCGGNFGISGDQVKGCFGHCFKFAAADSDLTYGIFGRVVEHSVGWNSSPLGPWSAATAGIAAQVVSYSSAKGTQIAIDADVAIACRTEGGTISAQQKHLGTP